MHEAVILAFFHGLCVFRFQDPYGSLVGMLTATAPLSPTSER